MVEYKIIDVRPMIDIDEAGRFYKKYRVRFVVGKIEDFIDVPESEFSTEHVRELVEKRAKEIAELMGK